MTNTMMIIAFIIVFGGILYTVYDAVTHQTNDRVP